MSSGLEHTVDLRHHVHGIARQVLEQLATDDRGEAAVGVGIDVLLGVEQIDVAIELFP